MKLASLLVGVVLGISLALAMPMAINYFIGYDKAIDSGYRALLPGMSLSEARVLMRGPGTRLESFLLGQEGGYELEYAAAARSGAKYFVRWTNPVDHYYTVGFDENDKVVYRARGTT